MPTSPQSPHQPLHRSRRRAAKITAAAAATTAMVQLAGGFTAPAAHATTPTATTAVITARSDLANGTGAHMVLRINGQYGGSAIVTGTSFSSYTFKLPTTVDPTTANVEVMFDNDGFSATSDRNLYVQKVVLGATTLTPNKAVYDRGDTWAQALDGNDIITSLPAGEMQWNGALRWDHTTVSKNPNTGTTVSVLAHGAQSNGWPTMALRVNGVQYGTATVNSTTDKTYTFQVPGHVDVRNAIVELLYLNDASDATSDRNLYVDSVDDGTHSLTPTQAVYDHGGTLAQATDGKQVSAGTNNLNSDGALRFVYDHVWGKNSPVYKPLPANAPIASNSSAIMQTLTKYGVQDYGDKTRNLPSLTPNVDKFGNVFAHAHNSDPTYNVSFHDCQHKGYTDPEFTKEMSGIHIPDSAKPASGTDGQIEVVNDDSGRVVDLWEAQKATANGKTTWSACWGGSIDNATADPTAQFKAGYGASASGLAMEPFTMKIAEQQAGRVDHPEAIALPVEDVNNLLSGLANRTDGDSKLPNTISEGMYLRLPASFKIVDSDYNAATALLMHTAQDYGLIVVDRSGADTLAYENKADAMTDPYPALFNNEHDYAVMWGNGGSEKPFPWSALQVVAKGFTPGK